MVSPAAFKSGMGIVNADTFSILWNISCFCSGLKEN